MPIRSSSAKCTGSSTCIMLPVDHAPIKWTHKMEERPSSAGLDKPPCDKIDPEKQGHLKIVWHYLTLFCSLSCLGIILSTLDE
jgi:hypothetical protein